jgi:hypothetical protein
VPLWKISYNDSPPTAQNELVPEAANIPEMLAGKSGISALF